MLNRVPDEATCAICGRHFDPSETRGWCPNPSCGEWQHPSFPIGEEAGDADEATEGATGDGDTEPTNTCPNCGNEVRADANFCKHCATPLDGDTAAAADEQEEPEPAGPECPDCGADLSDVSSDRLARCPICMFELGEGFGEPATETEGESMADSGTEPVAESGNEPAAEPEPPTVCPNCGEDLSPIPPELRTVCPGCRTDLEAEAGSAGTEPDRPRTDRAETDDASDSPPIEAADAVATGYEPRLRDAGVETVADLLAADPDDLSAKTGISVRRITNWVAETREERESADTDAPETTTEPDESAVEPGPESRSEPPTEPTESSDAEGFDSTQLQPSGSELVLEVMGREVSVADGQTVGAEVRSAMVEAGASESDAVYVHRKHVRIDAENGRFFLTRLGENDLEVNGRSIEKGDRVRIRDGDEITFSDVVTAAVSVR